MHKITLFICCLWIGLMACTPTDKSNSKEEKADGEVKLGQVEHEGMDIQYRICGEGDITLLFVHGWCIDQAYWDHQFEALCDSYQLVSIDLPGFGKSGKNRNAWTMEAYGSDIQAVMTQLELSNVVLVGHSMGGDVILEAAMGNEDVIALIGVDNFKDVGLDYGEEVQAEIDGFMNMLKQNFSAIAPAYAEGSLFHPSTDSLAKERVMQDFRQADSVAAIGSLEALFAYSPKESEQLAKLQQKLYLINSDATPTHVDGLKATGVDFEVIDIPATGHYPMIEKPALFTQLLKQTIDKIKAGG